MDGSVNPDNHHDDNGATAPVVTTTAPSTPTIPTFLFDNPDGTKTFSFANGEVANVGTSDNVDSMAIQRMPTSAAPFSMPLGNYGGRRAPIAQLKEEQSRVDDNTKLAGSSTIVDPLLVTIPRVDPLLASNSPAAMQDFSNVVTADRTMITPVSMNWANNVRQDLRETATTERNEIRLDVAQLQTHSLNPDEKREVVADLKETKNALDQTRTQAQSARTASFTV